MSFSYVPWRNILKENGLPNIRFHDLRATYCTLLVNKNFNLKAISKLMGHASEIISVDVYTEKSRIINDCLDELEPFIDSVAPKTNEDEFIINDVLNNLKMLSMSYMIKSENITRKFEFSFLVIFIYKC